MKFGKADPLNIVFSIIICLFVVNLIGNAGWTQRMLYKPVVSSEDLWRHTRYGDLAAFSSFYKDFLFVEDCSECTIQVPDYQKTTVDFAKTFWSGVPLLYLFPMKFVVCAEYPFVIKEEMYNKLMLKVTVQKRYRNRTFYLVKDPAWKNSQNWVLYMYQNRRGAHIFVLPEKLKEIYE